MALLHAGLLEDVLGITPEAQAAKTNLWYPQDAPAALADCAADRAEAGDVLFLMNATPVADVRAVAEAGHVMPQKSTFFYPKVLTGPAVHTLEPAAPRRVGLAPTRAWPSAWRSGARGLLVALPPAACLASI